MIKNLSKSFKEISSIETLENNRKDWKDKNGQIFSQTHQEKKRAPK